MIGSGRSSSVSGSGNNSSGLGGGTDSSVSCVFNGQAVVNGSSTIAYQSSVVAAGSPCVSETRVCTNGTLSGSYTYAACAPQTWNGVIDMGQVIAAFADRHPHQSKAASYKAHTGGASDMPADSTTERRWESEIFDITQYGNGAWTVYSPQLIRSDIVGFNGTFVIPWNKDNPPTYWDLNPEAPRYLSVSDTNKQVLVSSVQTYWDVGYPTTTNKILAGTGPLAVRIKEFGYKDFRGDIGKRWYVTQTTDLGVDTGYTGEWISYDLGPSVGIYDPEYGTLEYGQYNLPGLNPADYTYTDFGTITNVDPDENTFTQYFSYGACRFNGNTVPAGGSVAAYSAASVGIGQSCDSVKEIRSCVNGNLTGSNTFATCQSAAPSGLFATCSADGTQATLSWNTLGGATGYAVRVDDTTNQASGCNAPTVHGPGGSCVSPTDYVAAVSSNSVTVTIPANTNLTWWVHGLAGNTIGDPTIGNAFSCNAS